MRISRIDIDGYGTPNGSFRLPSSGLGLWATPNDTGKSRLLNALADAFYGPVEGVEARGWILVRLVLDDGTALAVTRDLTRDSLLVADTGGAEVTAEILGGRSDRELGQVLLGLSRERFLLCSGFGSRDLPRTFGESRLRIVLDCGRQAAAAAAEEPSAEMPTVDSSSAAVEAPANDLARLHRMKASLDILEGRFRERSAQLEEQSEKRTELLSEQERLATLTGAEPKDVGRLGELLDELRSAHQKCLSLDVARRNHEGNAQDHDIDLERLRALEEQFTHISEDELHFLEGFSQERTILRGNGALMRSEIRLDRSQVDEIDAARDVRGRRVRWLLSAAILGLFGSVLVNVLPNSPLSSFYPAGFGLLAASLGMVFLWRSRMHRAPEKAAAVDILKRKTAQLEEFEEEERRASEHLVALVRRLRAESASALLADLEMWATHRGSLDADRRLVADRAEIDREIVALREKLGSFNVGKSTGLDPTNLGAEQLEAMHRDYVRFFEVHREVEQFEKVVDQTEVDLAALETERLELREHIKEILERQGVGTETDIDRAIELCALRCESGELSQPAPLPAGEPTAWGAGVSARTEAIVRRFLPQVREVAVDSSLMPVLSCSVDGPRLTVAEMAKEQSASTLDLLAFSLRMAIWEEVSARGESIPLLLDDPLVQCDDKRHDQVFEFLVTDAAARGQVVLLTAHEVRSRWFLHQHPEHQKLILSLDEQEPVAAPSLD